MVTIDDMTRELAQLKRQYRAALVVMQDKVLKAMNSLDTPQGGEMGGTVSTHDAFNMGATASELATLAGRIAQTENVIRWMAK